ncbi:MAG: sulfatase [Kiritimatiellaeota bacterium]|nr:sulfatase [Kiritimatiellota bacterium]
MNLIFVLSDTFRRDHLTCYGRPPWGWDIHAPNLNRLAGQSVVFDRFYQGSFPTGPTVLDFMTGRFAFHTIGWAPIPAGTATLQSTLGRSGYVSMCITDCHPYFRPGCNYHQGFSAFEWVRGQQADNYRTAPVHVASPCAPGKCREYEKLVVPHLRNTAGRRCEREWFAPRVFQAAIDWLEENADQHESFFLYIHAFDVHEPWDPPRYYVERYDPGYAGEEVILPRYDRCDYLTDAELNHCRALYAGEIGLVDRWLGMLLDRVSDLGLDDDTVFVFTADHGFYIGDHGYIGKHTVLEPTRGWPLYDVIGHCPLLVRAPGQAPRHVDALCQHVDLAPTLLALLGVEPPPGLHGLSLAPVLRGEADSVRDFAINSVTLPTNPNVRAYSTVLDGEYALLYAGNQAPSELYHLPSDPRQERNIIRDGPGVARRLHERYVAELEVLGTDAQKLDLRRVRPTA